jgi:hypothetical protein
LYTAARVTAAHLNIYSDTRSTDNVALSGTLTTILLGIMDWDYTSKSAVQTLTYARTPESVVKNVPVFEGVTIGFPLGTAY